MKRKSFDYPKGGKPMERKKFCELKLNFEDTGIDFDAAVRSYQVKFNCSYENAMKLVQYYEPLLFDAYQKRYAPEYYQVEPAPIKTKNDAAIYIDQLTCGKAVEMAILKGGKMADHYGAARELIFTDPSNREIINLYSGISE